MKSKRVFFVCLLGGLLPMLGFAQDFAVAGKSSLLSNGTTIKSNPVQKKNIIKVNLSALLLKNFSFQYERAIGQRISAAVNVRTMPLGTLPFLPTIEDIVEDPGIPVNQIRLGNFGVTPEVRFYVGKRGALRGFYLAPFASYNNYKTNLPIKYDNDTRTGIFKGNITTLTGGLLLGAQWNLSKTLSLDWWIAGPNYGGANGDLNLVSALSPSEQTSLRNAIEDIKNDDGGGKIIETYTVNSNGANIKVNGPWGGLRGLGINLGIRF